LVAARRWEETLDWGERWIALGYTPEPAYCALMLAHSGRGDLSQVAAVYRRCIEALARDLGVEPSPQTQALYERLSSGEKVIETGGTAAFRERYRLADELGRGGLGVVYRGQDTLLDRPVAIKLLSPAASH
jgi:DNA-binding SARP family transcriptional activator